MFDFDWDAENLAHIARHGITAAEVEHVLINNPLALGLQDWHDEERFEEVGETSSGRVLVVITTWRNEKIRAVTAFDAPPYVVRAYLKKKLR